MAGRTFLSYFSRTCSTKWTLWSGEREKGQKGQGGENRTTDELFTQDRRRKIHSDVIVLFKDGYVQEMNRAGDIAKSTHSSEYDAMAKKTKKRWSRDVKTVSTYPPEGLFTKDAETIARTMASKKVSPRGIGSGIRMVQFFINRAGTNLPLERRNELEKAKQIMQAKASSRR